MFLVLETFLIRLLRNRRENILEMWFSTILYNNVAFNNFLSSHVSICKVNESYIPFCVNCAIILNEKVHCQICFGYGQSRDASHGILHDLSHESERCYLRRLH